MMHSSQNLYDELNRALVEVNRQIKTAIDEISSGTWINLEESRVENYDPYIQRDRNGQFILTPLIAAKAQILSAMAALKAAEMQPKGPRR